MDETTKEIVKFVVVIGALPWVLPFVRALLRDVIASVELDGGLLGDPPSEAKLKEILERRAREPDPLVNELLAHVRKEHEGGGRGPSQRR